MTWSSRWAATSPGRKWKNVLQPRWTECAVVEFADPHAGMIIKAFVVLQPGVPASQEVVQELQNFVKCPSRPLEIPVRGEVQGLPAANSNRVIADGRS
jgi:acyl-coenzyme A synthetase/AMP-(fatty) acid ligase